MIQNPINFWKVAAVLGPIHKDTWCARVRVCVYACVCIWLLRKSGLIIEALTLKIWAIVCCQHWCKQIISKLYSTFIKVVENVAISDKAKKRWSLRAEIGDLGNLFLLQQIKVYLIFQKALITVRHRWTHCGFPHWFCHSSLLCSTAVSCLASFHVLLVWCGFYFFFLVSDV